jgi:hypothetical protein
MLLISSFPPNTSRPTTIFSRCVVVRNTCHF